MPVLDCPIPKHDWVLEYDLILTDPDSDHRRHFWFVVSDAAAQFGVLRVHLGEVPYWKTEDLQDWKTRPGRVLQRELELVEPPARENRDPFCGVH
jgi:hypothetical protein